MRRPSVKFTVRGMLLAIAISAIFTYYVALPAWNYYRLPKKTRQILGSLRAPMTLPGNGATPLTLKDLLKAIKVASSGPKAAGIPLYVDPIGLQDADQMLSSEIAATTDRRPIKDHLDRALPALGLDYFIKDGLLTITSAKAARTTLQAHPADATHP